MEPVGRKELQRILDEGDLIYKFFPGLIYSGINVRDDNFSFDKRHGMTLFASGDQKQLMIFQPSLHDYGSQENWTFQFETEQAHGLKIGNESGDSFLFMDQNGKMGIGTTNPMAALDVNGIIGMESMIGTFQKGTVDADGEWNATKLAGFRSGSHMYEITAQVNDDDDQRFALSRAIVILEIRGQKVRRKIQPLNASSKWLWGRRWNKIQFRFALSDEPKKEDRSYQLEIRSRTHYGLADEENPKQIFYRVSKLY